MAEEQQIERELVVSADSDAVWDAITEAELASEWFDGEVEWELTPGGTLHIEGNDGESRDGVIQEVTPGESLQFVWWPSDRENEISEVTYRIETIELGTRFTVIEKPLSTSWTDADSAAFQTFACSALSFSA